jgi:hypothetical protein
MMVDFLIVVWQKLFPLSGFALAGGRAALVSGGSGRPLAVR